MVLELQAFQEPVVDIQALVALLAVELQAFQELVVGIQALVVLLEVELQASQEPAVDIQALVELQVSLVHLEDILALVVLLVFLVGRPELVHQDFQQDRELVFQGLAEPVDSFLLVVLLEVVSQVQADLLTNNHLDQSFQYFPRRMSLILVMAAILGGKKLQLNSTNLSFFSFFLNISIFKY